MAEFKVTMDNFEQEVLKADVPVLVDFWAEWCGPCKMVGPIISELADDYAGKLRVGKLNVDEEGALAAQFGIVSIPTMILFKDGKALAKTIGYQPKESLEAFIKTAL